MRDAFLTSSVSILCSTHPLRDIVHAPDPRWSWHWHTAVELNPSQSYPHVPSESEDINNLDHAPLVKHRTTFTRQQHLLMKVFIITNTIFSLLMAVFFNKVQASTPSQSRKGPLWFGETPIFTSNEIVVTQETLAKLCSICTLMEADVKRHDRERNVQPCEEKRLQDQAHTPETSCARSASSSSDFVQINREHLECLKELVAEIMHQSSIDDQGRSKRQRTNGNPVSNDCTPVKYNRSSAPKGKGHGHGRESRSNASVSYLKYKNTVLDEEAYDTPVKLENTQSWYGAKKPNK